MNKIPITTLIPAVLGMLIFPVQAAEPTKPNVILIISDDQGYTDYGFMGHGIAKTPHLDIADLKAPEKSLTAQVVIDGWWKLIIPGPVKPVRSFATVPDEISLFELKTDPTEQNNVADQHPEVVKRLKELQEAQWNP